MPVVNSAEFSSEITLTMTSNWDICAVFSALINRLKWLLKKSIVMNLNRVFKTLNTITKDASNDRIGLFGGLKK